MEDMVRKLEISNPNSKKYITQKKKYSFLCKRILQRQKNDSYCI